MKRALEILAFASLALFTLPVAADAPVGPTPDNPTRLAQYEAFDKYASEINDNYTKLTWERFATRQLRTYAAAETACTSNFAGGRLPTVKELLTIVDEDPHQQYEFGKTVYKAIDAQAFGPNTGVDKPYFTSTPTGTTDEVWGISFADGTMVRLKKTDQAYARCVK